jgi:predicted transcriptional regulator
VPKPRVEIVRRMVRDEWGRCDRKKRKYVMEMKGRIVKVRRVANRFWSIVVGVWENYMVEQNELEVC